MPRLLACDLGLMVRIARLATEVDGIALAHHRVAKIGHSFRATYCHDPAETVLVPRRAIHVAALDQCGEPRLGRAAAGPGLAVGLLQV
jgi:hypothetical protein